MEVSSQLHALTILTTVPIQKQAGWTLEPVWMQWQREKVLSLLLLGTAHTKHTYPSIWSIAVIIETITLTLTATTFTTLIMSSIIS